MTLLELIAKTEFAVRPIIAYIPPSLTVRLFTAGRNAYLPLFAHVVPTRSYEPPEELGVTAWGLRFRLPIWNAAGMFKSGAGYAMVAREGAGAFVAGTSTSRPRNGNIRDRIKWPSTQYPFSHSAANWMGLPNAGHVAVAAKLALEKHVAGCPMGISVSAEPGLDDRLAVSELVEGMRRFDDAGVDYIELNESCPNVEGHARHAGLDPALLTRLDAVATEFLTKRRRKLPVVVKLSTDTAHEQIPALVHALVERGFDGMILGNTSTRYDALRTRVHEKDRAMFDYFTKRYGGGVSGALLTASSLESCRVATGAVRDIAPSHEFHVIRCGGVMTLQDIEESRRIGVLLNQWYVGYFEMFARHGHGLYRVLSERMRPSSVLTLS
ncbi:MAG TPA: hypothetical protein DCZ59_10860 [Bacteroidetes bacterium]|nr:hypothetical protein [Bacteroidota bacterium]